MASNSAVMRNDLVVGPAFLLLLLLLLGSARAIFRLESASPTSVERLPGESVELLCSSTSPWTSCGWEHGGCRLSFDRVANTASKEGCGEVIKRIRYIVSSTFEQCGLEVTGLVVSDAGTWRCVLEERAEKGDGVTIETDLKVKIKTNETEKAEMREEEEEEGFSNGGPSLSAGMIIIVPTILWLSSSFICRL